MEEKEMKNKNSLKKTEIKTKKKNSKINKKSIIGVICGVIVILLAIVLIFVNRSTDCHKIAREISKFLDNSTLIDAGADKEYKYSFIDSTIIYTEEVGGVEDEDYAIAIAQYNSSEEAKIKAKHLEDLYVMLHEKIDDTLLEEHEDIDEYFEGEDDLIFTNGIYLIRIDSYYKDIYSELKKEITNILKKYNTKDIKATDIVKVKKYWNKQLLDLENYLTEIHGETMDWFDEQVDEYIEKIDECRGSACKDYLDEFEEFKKYPELADRINKIQNKYDEVMNRKKEVVNSINSSISSVEKTLNGSDFDEVKNKIADLNDSYYNEYKEGWNNRLKAIEEKVYKKSCVSYNYKDVLRNPNNYKANKAYWFGVVSQKVNSYQYRVGVDCTKYTYIDGYSCKNTIYVEYYGDVSIIEDDVVKLWGIMDGTVTYTAVLGNSITIPSFKAEYISIQ